MTKNEVIETIRTWIHTIDDEYDIEEQGRVYGLMEALELVKQIEPEPKVGHWIEQIDHEENCRTLICSNCNRPALHDGNSIWKHKFCPHCGAQMVDEEV